MQDPESFQVSSTEGALVTNNQSSNEPFNLKIPRNKLHKTCLEKIMQRRPLSSEDYEIRNNSIKFKAQRISSDEDAIFNKRVIAVHNWKNISVSVLGFLDSSLEKSLSLAGKSIFRLKRLRFRFPEGAGFRDNQFVGTISHITRNLKETQKLSFIFRKCQITDNALKRAGTVIVKNLPNLKGLRFDCLMSDNTTGKPLVAKISRNLPRLKFLFHNFGSCALNGDDNVTYIGKTLGQRMKNLEQIVLYFWGSQNLSDEGLKALARNICRNLVDLRVFGLNLRGCSKLSPEGLAVLADEISQNLTNLEKLVLIFGSCSGIEASDLSSLKSTVQKHLGKRNIVFEDEHDDMIDGAPL